MTITRLHDVRFIYSQFSLFMGIVFNKIIIKAELANTEVDSTTLLFFVGWEMQYNKNSHSYGQLLIGIFITIMHPLMCHILCRVFGKTSNYPGDSAPLQPRFWALRLLAFPNIKIPLKRKRFQTIDGIQKNMMGQLMVIERTVWGPKVPTLKRTEVLLPYVQYSLYLVSSSINVSSS